MSNIQVHKPVFSLQPTTFQEAREYSEILAKSSFVPKNYMGKPNDILAAVQYGAEVGLKPLQSLQNVAVINGKPSIYGDAAKALVEAHPSCISVEEIFDKEKLMYTCIAKRKNKPDVVYAFSKEDAVTAALWGKAGPWTNYPKRMLQMRARSFALRDQFPDVLLGLILAEEAGDYVTIDAEPIKQEKDNVISIKSDASFISINEPLTPPTYRFAELDGTFTKHMTDEETLEYLKNKITALETPEDDDVYIKFKEANATLINRYFRNNKKEAIDLGNTYKAQIAYIKGKIQQDEVDLCDSMKERENE